MPEKKSIDETMREYVNKLPEPVINYWIANRTKPVESLLCYSEGFFDGRQFIIETLLKPYIEKVDKFIQYMKSR
jgi:hypothetical protein